MSENKNNILSTNFQYIFQNNKWSYTVQAILILTYFAQLLDTSALYINYLMLGLIVVACFGVNINNGRHISFESFRTYQNILVICFSAAFSLIVTLANYELCYYFFPLSMVVFFIVGCCPFWHLFNAIAENITAVAWKQDANIKGKAKHIFWLCFFIIVVINSIVLFCIQYPGVLTPDSINQVTQLLTENYANHHPYYHTQVIKMLVTIGMKLFNEINAAVAIYSFFQILFMAGCFAFTAHTMAMIGAPRWIIYSSVAFYALMPYHILYSITMWKDVMFGGFVLLLIIAVFRCIKNVGGCVFNYALLAVSSMGMCLFRHNGLFAFVLLSVACVLIWKLQKRKMLAVFFLVIFSSFFMKHTVLELLGVQPIGTVESLSIPVQQIAKVVQKGRPLSDWERQMLEKVIDVDQIPEKYIPYIADPIRRLVREKGNQHVLVENKLDYFKLYVSLGRKYPFDYLTAWISQTRGYWNAGYRYWVWAAAVEPNDLGIERTINSKFLNKCLNIYLWLFSNIQVLMFFISIGTFVWVHMIMFFVGLVRKDKLGIFLTLPVIFLVISLIVATMVFSEFRYIYAAFCTLPFVLVVSLRPSPCSNAGRRGGGVLE